MDARDDSVVLNQKVQRRDHPQTHLALPQGVLLSHLIIYIFLMFIPYQI